MVMPSIRVTITPELVERGVQEDSRHCMIAEAIKEQNPHFERVLVDLQTIRWSNPRTGKRYICLTPEVAGSLLVDFDQGREIEPFAFSLRPTQVTPNKKGTRPKTAHGRKQIDGQLVIHGGVPTQMGHLGGSSSLKAANRLAKKREREEQAGTPPEGASNVVRSKSRYRQYGLRLLKG
jgi:hypothetical protein